MSTENEFQQLDIEKPESRCAHPDSGFKVIIIRNEDSVRGYPPDY